MTGELLGYRGRAEEILRRVGASIGDMIRVTWADEVLEGVLMPRSADEDDQHIVLKLKSGYNAGIDLSSMKNIEVLRAAQRPMFTKPPIPSGTKNLPRVVIISTGGTIASKVDYRTGAVEPALTAEDLYGVVPELSEIANIETEVLFNVFSENLTPKHWTELAQCVGKHIHRGANGIVVAQGTDTLGYSAAALSFAIRATPVPIVFVGAQRSSDRPSSDAASNLIGATQIAAYAPFSEVILAMHEGISDDYIVCHRGTRVRKCHTSRRDAFKSVNSKPIARLVLKERRIEVLSENYVPRDMSRALDLKPNFCKDVVLIKFYPGMPSSILEWVLESDFKGVVIEGTGLGHVSELQYEPIKKLIMKGIPVVMTSQCIWGRVHMNVYSTGRDLLRIGVIPAEDMLPETALVKMMWALGQTSDPREVEKIMKTNLAHEITLRRTYNGSFNE